jgi:hypothetical protein
VYEFMRAGHDQVRDYEVGPLVSNEREGLLAIFSFAYDGIVSDIGLRRTRTISR